jgi:hypothetical protein
MQVTDQDRYTAILRRYAGVSEDIDIGWLIAEVGRLRAHSERVVGVCKDYRKTGQTRDDGRTAMGKIADLYSEVF